MELEKSAPIEEIIGKPPPWIIQWGTYILLGILAIIISFIVSINFPETIKLKCKLNTHLKKEYILAKENCVLIKYGVIQGDVVNKNDSLFLIQVSKLNHQVFENVMAPISGKIFFGKQFKIGQTFIKSNVICFILSADSFDITTSISETNISNYQINKPARLILKRNECDDDSISSTIVSISNKLIDSKYIFCLKTNQNQLERDHRNIDLMSGTSGYLEIQTNRRIVDEIFQLNRDPK